MEKASVDKALLHAGAHSASYFALSRSMGDDAKIVDFCIPCNPYYPTPEMFALLREQLETILKYYPSDSSSTTNKLVSVLGLHPQTVAMANGSTELITWIDHLLIKESIAIPIPTFGRWTDQPLETGKRVDMFLLHEADNFRLDLNAYLRFIRQRGSRVAVVCNPNNPDGGFVPRQELLWFVDELHDLDLVVVDESFIDFVDAERYPSLGPDAAIRPNVIVLKSLGKNFGLHGIRFGYMVANPSLTETIGKVLPKWNINSLAEAVVYMLKDYEADYRESLRLLARDRQSMYDALARVPGLTVFPSQGNFLLVKLPPEWSGGVELRDYLISEHGVYVRECGNKLGMTSQFLRLVVRPPQDVDRLIEGMLDYGRQQAGGASANGGRRHRYRDAGYGEGGWGAGQPRHARGEAEPANGNGYPANGNGYPTNGNGYQTNGKGYPANGSAYPASGAPTYAGNGTPAYPASGSPAYPASGNPSYPASGSPAYPASGNPSYPASGGPSYRPASGAPAYRPASGVPRYPTRRLTGYRHGVTHAR